MGAAHAQGRAYTQGCCLEGLLHTQHSYGSRRGPVHEPKSIEQRLGSRNAQERVFALGLIPKAGAQAAQYVDSVVELLIDPAWIVQQAAAKVLSNLAGDIVADAFPKLRDLAQRHADPCVRLLADSVLELHGCGQNLSQDRDLVMAAVRRIGGSLRYAFVELQQDREIVIEAIRHSDGCAIQYAAPEMRADDEVVRVAFEAGESKGSEHGRARVLQYVSEDLRKREQLLDELDSYTVLIQRYRRLEDSVFRESLKPLCTGYLARRAGLVKLMRELSSSLGKPELWTKAVVVLDAFYAKRGESQPVQEDFAVAAVTMVLRTERRRFRYKDAAPILVDLLGAEQFTSTLVKALHCAETFILSTLRGQVMLPSVNDWAVALLDRLELKVCSDKRLLARVRAARQEVLQTAELMAARVPTCTELPPRALARCACAAAFAQSGVLSWEDVCSDELPADFTKPCSFEMTSKQLAEKDAPSTPVVVKRDLGRDHSMCSTCCSPRDLAHRSPGVENDDPCVDATDWESPERRTVSSSSFDDGPQSKEKDTHTRQGDEDGRELSPGVEDGENPKLDITFLAWAAGCSIGTLRTDTQATLKAAWPVIPPAA